MAVWKKAAIIVIAAAIILGSLFALTQQTDQPRNQHYSLYASAVYNNSPVTCPDIPRNYTDWLEIHVLGNRTSMNFQRATVYGLNIQVGIPLNQTAFVYTQSFNSSYEILYVPLPDYWAAGDNLVVSVTYFFTGFTPQTDTLPQIALVSGSVDCP